MRKIILFVFLACILLVVSSCGGGGGGSGSEPSQVTIRLVSEKDHIEGSFTTNQAIYADQDRIYLASYQGKLFVLARDRAADFPILEVRQDTNLPLISVQGDDDYLYVTSADGYIRKYCKDYPLVLVKTANLHPYGLNSIALVNKKLYVSTGQASMAVDKDHVFLSQLNEGDMALEVSLDNLTPVKTYGKTFVQDKMLVFNRRSEALIVMLQNPSDVLGRTNLRPTLYADSAILAQTITGCCGPGILIYNPETLILKQTIDYLFTNTVLRRERWLIAGNEGGQVVIFDLSQNPSPLVSSVDLRQLTGHTNPEDIEIRALWMDNHDNLVFAGSSWGNDQSRGPSLPSFFVLELSP